MPERIGTMLATCTSSAPGVPKYPRPDVEIGHYGLVGDYHNRERRRSFSIPGTTKPNTDRHITIVAEEAYDYINGQLATTLRAGDFGENFLVRGLGDLSEIDDGAYLLLGGETILRVTEQNKPCKNLKPYHRLMVKTAYGRRGLLCSIERGQGDLIIPGDQIEVVA